MNGRIYTLYELHFTIPYRHAQHYIGVTVLPLDERLRIHRSGQGARLIAALMAAGGDFVVWRTQTFKSRVTAYDAERWLKRRGGARRRCTICSPRLSGGAP